MVGIIIFAIVMVVVIFLGVMYTERSLEKVQKSDFKKRWYRQITWRE